MDSVNKSYDYLMQEYQELKTQVELLKRISEKNHSYFDELAWLASFSEDNPYPIIEVRQDGTINYQNPASEKCFPTLYKDGLSHPLLQEYSKIFDLLKNHKQKYFSKEIQIFDKVYFQIVSLLYEKNLLRIYAVDITESVENIKIIQKQAKLFSFLSESTSILLTHPNIKEAIGKTLDLIGISTEADRIYFAEYIIDHETALEFYSIRNEFCKPSIQPQLIYQTANYFSVSEIFRWHTILKAGDNISGLVETFPPDERVKYQSLNVKSILAVPIMSQLHYYGFLCFEDYTFSKTRKSYEHYVIKTISENIGAAINREISNRLLIDSKKKAEEMNRLKTIFLNNLSHEIRTPMVTVLGYSQILLDEISKPEHKVMVEDIYSSGKRMMDTLNSLLDLSKIESNSVNSRKKPINIKDIITDSYIYFKDLANNKKLEFTLEFSNEEIKSLIDPYLFGRIINNLVDNAIKFTMKGSVKVKVIEDLKDKNSGYLIVEIIDTGIGIPKDYFEIIFKEFRQVSEGLGRYYEGTGIGLTIVKKYVEILSGEIVVESEVGKGSKFTIKIPHERPLEEEKASTENRAIASNGKIQISDKTILLVENDPGTYKLMRRMLRNICNLELAENGEKAIDLLTQKNYNAILMDINLGYGLTGTETTKEIRETLKNVEIPIVALTAYVVEEDETKLLSQGFTHYMAKPFERMRVIELVKSLLK